MCETCNRDQLSANAAAVVNSFVFEAGVNSFVGFCAYRTLPVVIETTSMPQKPPLKSGCERIVEMRSASGLSLAACAWTASIRHSKNANCARFRCMKMIKL